MSTEITISNRNRNLGLGWTNDVEQTEHGLSVRQVSAPDVTGGLRSVERELNHGARVNNSNDWRVALFVGGQRITAIWGTYWTGCGRDEDGFEKSCPVGRCEHWADGWIAFDKRQLTETLDRLRRGESVRVKVA